MEGAIVITIIEESSGHDQRGCLGIIRFIVILHTMWLLQTNFKYPPQHSSRWKILLQIMNLEPNPFWHIHFYVFKIHYMSKEYDNDALWERLHLILFRASKNCSPFIKSCYQHSTAMGLCMGYSTSQPVCTQVAAIIVLPLWPLNQPPCSLLFPVLETMHKKWGGEKNTRVWRELTEMIK